MKIVISSQGQDLSSPVDPRFGRAAYFIVADSQTGDFKSIANTQNLNLPQGAGIQAGKTVVNAGAQVLITGHCGPKAFQVLQAGNIEVYTGASGTVKDAIAAFNEGRLSQAQAPDVEGHW